MSLNFLQLKMEKTELINIMSPFHLSHFGTLSINIDTSVIASSSKVRNLGVIFDQHLTMDHQVSNVIKTCNYHLRNIGKVRQFLSTDACKTAIQCLVTSRLDYCCSLFAGISQTQVHRLQLLQNKAARMITKSQRTDHITPILAQLHWLPANLRIRFRLLTYVHKCILQLAPSYLQELLTIYQPTRPLRSSNDRLILLNTPSCKKVGNQSFFHTAPLLWNCIPLYIRNTQSVAAFKKNLKTFLFQEHFS